jgi:hypothetical protein
VANGHRPTGFSRGVAKHQRRFPCGGGRSA